MYNEQYLQLVPGLSDVLLHLGANYKYECKNVTYKLKL